MSGIINSRRVVALGATLAAVGLLAGGDPGNTADGAAVEVVERPVLTDAEYDALAAELRDKYAADPATWPAASWIEGVERREIGLLPGEVPYPEDNPYSEAKADLGEQLFFDGRLSVSGAVACASCHDPDLGWADGRAVSFGHERRANKRNAPTVRNVAFNAGPEAPHRFLWDGKAESLESQALLPIGADNEMGGDAAVILQRLNAVEGYRRQFEQVFGDPTVTPERIGRAIATFERGVVGGKSRFDAFLRGRPDALGDDAVRGLHLYRTAAGCINCHNGPNLTDDRFHNTGLSNYGRPFEDLGLYDVTKKPEDVGKFKTPTLRDVTRTSPYMHNGLFEFDSVLVLYNAGMPNLRPRKGQEDDPLFPTKTPLVRPLGLNDRDLGDLKAFLESLEEPRVRVRPPELPE